MEDKDITVLGIVLEGGVVADFLGKIVKIFNGPEARDFLRLLAYEDVNFRHILEEGVPAPGEIDKLTEELQTMLRDRDYHKRSSESHYKDIVRLRNDNKINKEKARISMAELDNYISAIRHYEDNLSSMGLRSEIIRREDFAEVFSDEEEEGWTT